MANVKSAREQYQALMNGEGEGEAPMVDIDIVVKNEEDVVDAEDLTSEGDELESDLQASEDAEAQAEADIEEAEMLVKLLNEDGLHPSVLKIISARPLYRDIWNIPMPGSESLDVTGRNDVQAKQLANAIQARVEGFRETMSKWGPMIKDRLAKFLAWIKNLFPSKKKSMEKIQASLKDLKADDINKEKANAKKVTMLKLSDVKAIKTLAGKIVNLNLDSLNTKTMAGLTAELGELKKLTPSEVPVADIVSNFAGSYAYYNVVKDCMAFDANIETTIKGLQKVVEGITGANTGKYENDEEKQKAAEIKKAVMDSLKALMGVSKQCAAAVSSFIKGGSAVRSCKN